MEIFIKRGEREQRYRIPFKSVTLLKALYHIKSYQDQSLTFDFNCRSGVCGACAVRINGREALACSSKIKSGDKIEPLKYHKVLRDLKVDRVEKDRLKKSTAWLKVYKKVEVTSKDIELTERQSDCILCSSCYSACPVLEVNPNFIGPFALTRAYRYILEPREEDKRSTIDNIQSNGIWDCTLCGECTSVCPQNIDPKMDILKLRGEASQFGYLDPNFMNLSFNSYNI